MEMPDESLKVMLVRVEGKLDLSNLRHEQTDARLQNHETWLHRNSTDISSLQAKAFVNEGKSQGLLTSGKIIWTAVGTMLGGGGLAALIRLTH